MAKSTSLKCHQRLVSIAILLCGIFLLSISLEDIHTAIGYNSEESPRQQRDSGFDWMDTRGITLSRVVGNPATCKDVIYSGDSRDPFKPGRSESEEIIYQGWKGMAHVVHFSPALSNTCFVFFQIASPWIDSRKRELHPVWGRLPATSLVFDAFPNADIFLYMDTDALLAFNTKSPTMIYKELAFDGHAEGASMQHLNPGLIVNKPFRGWLCGQCERYGLGHGCFNSGVLLWHRDRTEPILKAWWESRNTDNSHNFVSDGEGFHGWSDEEEAERLGNKMGEQNRLMYIFGTNKEVRNGVWPVPRQPNLDNGSTSCPNSHDKDHVPCLQVDQASTVKWNPTSSYCFVSHFADDKEDVLKHASEMKFYDRRRRLRAFEEPEWTLL